MSIVPAGASCAGPARAAQHGHVARRRVDRVEIDQRLAQRLIGTLVPAFLAEEFVKTHAAADTEGAAFLALALAGDDGNVDPGHRPYVAHPVTVGAQDLHHLPAGGDRGGYLAHLRILVAQIGVDLGQQLDLLLEGRRTDRIVLAVELGIGPLRCCCVGAGMAMRDGAYRIGRARKGAERKLAGMSIANRFTGNRTQPKTLVGVERAALEAAIVEGQRFRLGVLYIEFAVISPGQGVRDALRQGCLVAIEEGEKVLGHAGLLGRGPCM